eukprot:TRINITY_DN7585_c0_g1_i13.p1 TRINITY_DN7585_c0_g1~~TRINITY_DN7585_c0_g1_i13.p1  ORF type:complete len:188 (+),score=2.64 TRINITY_DN7585_c0_g1_i13:243-806(+)
MEACWAGHHAIVKVMLNATSFPDQMTNGGHSALMLAAFRGHSNCVTTLLEANASLEVRDSQAPTAHFWAAFGGGGGAFELLDRAKVLPEQVARAIKADASLMGQRRESASVVLSTGHKHSVHKMDVPALGWVCDICHVLIVDWGYHCEECDWCAHHGCIQCGPSHRPARPRLSSDHEGCHCDFCVLC